MLKSLSGALCAATLLLVCCATPAPPPPARALPVAEKAPPIPQAGLRPLPLRKLPSQSFYPAPARRLELTGRVLVEFRLEGSHATGVTVIAAQADPVLQKSAVHLVESATYEGHDPTDPRPFYMSVQFCLGTCRDLVPYPGYEQNALTVTGSKLPHA